MSSDVQPSGLRPEAPFWWRAKVGLSLLLILYNVATIFEGAPFSPLAHAPTMLAQGLILFGAFLNIIHWSALRGEIDNLRKPTRLIKDVGLYSFIRHPMYLGDFVIAVGFVLFRIDLITIVLAVLITLALVLQAWSEERELEERFPQDFNEWRGRTRLLIPFVF